MGVVSTVLLAGYVALASWSYLKIRRTRAARTAAPLPVQYLNLDRTALMALAEAGIPLPPGTVPEDLVRLFGINVDAYDNGRSADLGG